MIVVWDGEKQNGTNDLVDEVSDDGMVWMQEGAVHGVLFFIAPPDDIALAVRWPSTSLAPRAGGRCCRSTTMGREIYHGVLYSSCFCRYRGFA